MNSLSNMNNFLNKYKYTIIAPIIFVYSKAFAAGLVPCEGIDDCNFDSFVKMLNNLAGFVIFRLPILLLVFMLAWSGVNMIRYRDNPGQLKEVKKNLLNVLLGYLLVLGAYIIVKTFITILAGDDLTFKVFFN